MRRILVADDNAVSRELLRHVLQGLCDEVLEAADGRQALQQIADSQPDVVLLDLEMPALDGYQVLRELRQDPRFAHTPVVAVTAWAMQGNRERGLEAGFDGYFTKPVNIAELRRYVQQLLEP